MRIELPVANGLRTDHPVLGLPFVDDSHLPIHDGQAIEAHGRHDCNAGWGRYDRDQNDERRWTAFTNDQFNLTFSWLVRHDPGYGRTVLLYTTSDDATVHNGSPWVNDPVVYRTSGYWWDSTTWRRPAVLFDSSTEEAVIVPVPDAVSFTAADYATMHPGHSGRGQRADTTTFIPGKVGENQWAHDLAYWAACRPEDGLSLQQCFVDVSAAELDSDALLSKSAAAREIGLSRSAINEALNAGGGAHAERFTFPQRHTSEMGSPRWSTAVLREWLWERQQANSEPVVKHLSRGSSHPDADGLLDPISSAVMWQMQRTYDPKTGACRLGLPLERVLGWVVTEQPHLAEALFGDIIRSARQQLDLSDDTVMHTLREAVRWGASGKDEDNVLEKFLRHTLPPSMSQ